MNQAHHRRAEDLPVYKRVYTHITHAVKTAATATVNFLRNIAEMFVPSMQPSFAGMTTSVDNTTHRTDGFAGTKTPLMATIASAMNRQRDHGTGNTTAAMTRHSHRRADTGIKTAHDGNFGTGLDPSATSAVLQT